MVIDSSSQLKAHDNAGSEQRSLPPDATMAASSRSVSLAGRIDYCDGLKIQYAAQRAVQERRCPNTLYLLEHSPVITIGRGAGSSDKDLRTSRAELAARGIAIVEADRGGDTTYHAPGQLVGYSIIDLQLFGRDLHRYLRTLEAIIITALAEFDVSGYTVPGLTGVWVNERKIAAIGIKVSRWVSLHGFSVNNAVCLDVMRRDIVPCGIADRGVASLSELGVRATREQLEEAVRTHWAGCFGGPRPSSAADVQWRDELRTVGEGCSKKEQEPI